MTIDIYSKGLCYCSVCAPADMPVEEVVDYVNLYNPTGIASKWQLSEEKVFADNNGVNGGLFTCDGKQTRHWLMVC